MKKLLLVTLALAGFANSSLFAGKFMCVNKKYFEANCIDDKDTEATTTQARCCIGKGLTTKDAQCVRPGTYGCKTCNIVGSNVTCSQCDRASANDQQYSTVLHSDDDLVCEYRSKHKKSDTLSKNYKVDYITTGSYDEGIRVMEYDKTKKQYVSSGKRTREYSIYTGEGEKPTYNNDTVYSDRH